MEGEHLVVSCILSVNGQTIATHALIDSRVSDLDVRTLYGGGRWCRRRMRGADGDERRRRMKDIPTGKLGPAGSRISFVYIEVPYSCTNKIKHPIIYII